MIRIITTLLIYLRLETTTVLTALDQVNLYYLLAEGFLFLMLTLFLIIHFQKKTTKAL